MNKTKTIALLLCALSASSFIHAEDGIAPSTPAGQRTRPVKPDAPAPIPDDESALQRGIDDIKERLSEQVENLISLHKVIRREIERLEREDKALLARIYCDNVEKNIRTRLEAWGYYLNHEGNFIKTHEIGADDSSSSDVDMA